MSSETCREVTALPLPGLPAVSGPCQTFLSLQPLLVGGFNPSEKY